MMYWDEGDIERLGGQGFYHLHQEWCTRVEGRVWWMCGGCVSWRIDRIGRSESVRACADGLNAGVGGERDWVWKDVWVCVGGWVSEGVSV